MRKLRRLSGLAIAASLFLVLGIGNLVMGRAKVADCDQTLAEALAQNGGNQSPDSLLHKKITSRRSFYTIVSMGGVGFICLSAALWGCDILKRRR